MDNLSFNRAVYRLLTNTVRRRCVASVDDALVNSIEHAARFAWKNYTGLLADLELEQHLMSLARADRTLPPPVPAFEPTDATLHYVTTVYPVGGHTRVLANWIRHDRRSSAVFFRKQTEALPDVVTGLPTRLVVNTDASVAGTIAAFEAMVHEMRPSRIVLHHHPDDCLPVILKARLPSIPFIYFNHADFVFSLGPSTDVTVSINTESARINARYRGAHQQAVLPLFIDKPFLDKPPPPRSGIEIAVMASDFKMVPYAGWNIFELADALAGLHIVNRVNFIGCSEQFASRHHKPRHREKLCYWGSVPDPDSILARCHAYIESVPVGTGLGTLEAIALGCYPIFNPTRLMVYPYGAALQLLDDSSLVAEYESIKSNADLIAFAGRRLLGVSKGEASVRPYQDAIRVHNTKFTDAIEAIYRLATTDQAPCEARNSYYINTNMRHFARLWADYRIASIWAQLSGASRGVFAWLCLLQFGIIGRGSSIGPGRLRHVRHLAGFVLKTSIAARSPSPSGTASASTR